MLLAIKPWRTYLEISLSHKIAHSLDHSDGFSMRLCQSAEESFIGICSCYLFLRRCNKPEVVVRSITEIDFLFAKQKCHRNLYFPCAKQVAQWVDGKLVDTAFTLRTLSIHWRFHSLKSAAQFRDYFSLRIESFSLMTCLSFNVTKLSDTVRRKNGRSSGSVRSSEKSLRKRPEWAQCVHTPLWSGIMRDLFLIRGH